MFVHLFPFNLFKLTNNYQINYHFKRSYNLLFRMNVLLTTITVPAIIGLNKKSRNGNKMPHIILGICYKIYREKAFDNNKER